MTLAETLRDAAERLQAAGIGDPRLEADVLLAHVLGLSREKLLARLREPLSAEARTAFETLLARRIAREPSAYIVGHREFYGVDLACTLAAPVPRPETELLVDDAIDFVRRRTQAGVDRLKRGSGRAAPGLPSAPLIADIGTGTGAIAVALALHLTEARVIAVDTSRPALKLARCNAVAHGVAERVDVVQGTLLDPLRARFDLIAANLPYVPARTYRKLPPEIQEHEPEPGIRAGSRGTALIEGLLTSAPTRLRPGGLLLAEHGWNQGPRLRRAARAAFPDARIETKRDLAGLDRMLVVETE